MGPPLSSINRSVLIGAYYFVSPMAGDIFSVKAIANIADWYQKWWGKLENAKRLAEEPYKNLDKVQKIQFAGYVTQQYVAKSIGSQRIPVNVYERIIQDRLTEKPL